MECESCYFWEPDEDNDWGHCHHFFQAPEPEIVDFYTRNSEDPEHISRQLARSFVLLPLTLADDFCEDWNPADD
jgi:hypothetical protein